MCLLLRKTARRGRASEPLRRFRIRSCMRSLTSFWDTLGILLTSGFSGFFLQQFADIPNALVFVGIRFPQRPNVGRNLANLLPVNAADHQPRLLIDGDVDY